MNGSMNSAEKDMQELFQRYKAQLTPLQLEWLRFLDNPQSADLLQEMFPDFDTHEDYYNLLGDDLYCRGLVNRRLKETAGTMGVGLPRPTRIGKLFLEHISGQ